MYTYVFIPIELNERALAEGITEAEISAVIRDSRSNLELVYNPKDETYTCHANAGNIVLWTCFKESASGIILEDFYYNRTSIGGVNDASETEVSRVSPYLERYADSNLTCVKCDKKLVLKKVIFNYLKQNYHAVTYTCPVCGLVFEPHEMIDRQHDSIEKVLEGK
jgi:transcription elongation factor Elf1